MRSRRGPALTQSVDDLLSSSRKRISRVTPSELADVTDSGGIVIDIRPAHQRSTEGPLPGALIVERNVLEWRLDPSSPHRLPAVRDHHQQVIVVCTEGYASSLAAASLADLGFERPGDLEGGYKAWATWARDKARPCHKGSSLPDARAQPRAPLHFNLRLRPCGTSRPKVGWSSWRWCSGQAWLRSTPLSSA